MLKQLNPPAAAGGRARGDGGSLGARRPGAHGGSREPRAER